MVRVVDIIKSALPHESRDDSDEIEIPLDELDTLTLRKLQQFVNVSTLSLSFVNSDKLNRKSFQGHIEDKRKQKPLGGSVIGKRASSSETSNTGLKRTRKEGRIKASK
jgi:hypothetical protein